MLQRLMIWMVRCQLRLFGSRCQIQLVPTSTKVQMTFCWNLNCFDSKLPLSASQFCLTEIWICNRYFTAAFLLIKVLLPYFFSHLKWSVLNLEMPFLIAHGWKHAPWKNRYRWPVHQLSSNQRSREEKEITPSTHLRLCPVPLSLTAGKFSSSFPPPAPSLASDSGKSMYPPHLPLSPLNHYLTNHSG